MPEYEIKQSPTEIMAKLPMRALACGPGSSGKTVVPDKGATEVPHPDMGSVQKQKQKVWTLR